MCNLRCTDCDGPVFVCVSCVLGFVVCVVCVFCIASREYMHSVRVNKAWLS